MHINDKIKEIRLLKKMSQQAFADLLEEKRSTYAEWEDKIIPTFDKIVKISIKTGVSILEFVATIDEKAALDAINVDISSITKSLAEKIEVSKKPIELKKANGDTLLVVPETESQVDLLNAFLQERDRVIDNKQDRIDELLKDKDQLFKVLNSDLDGIEKVQQAIFAMVRTLQQHEAAKTSQGNKKREAEMLDTLSKLNGVNQEVDAKGDNALVLHMSGK